MFVYRNCDLPPDPTFPSDLGKLGYTINENDQVRQIANPGEGFRYRINRNDRYNVKNREALNNCIRPIVMQRLQEFGLEVMRLPLGRTAKDPHVPILVTDNIRHAPRVIAVFGDPVQDLGIWTYRSIGRDGINIGSAVSFTKAVLSERDKTGVALVLSNTGQLLWHCQSASAITQQSWLAAPRPYGNWGQATLTWRNKVPGNRDWNEHVEYVFEHVLRPSLGVHTRIDVIGVSEGGRGAIRYLKKCWHFWHSYISGICLADPLQTTYSDLDMSTLGDPTSFTSFVSSRCRSYVMSEAPVGTPQSGYREHGCNCYSSGQALYNECIITSAWPDMLKWLNMLYEDPNYAEDVMIRADDMDEEMRKDLEEQVARSDEEGDADGDDAHDHKTSKAGI